MSVWFHNTDHAPFKTWYDGGFKNEPYIFST